MCGNVHTDVSRLDDYVYLCTVFLLSLTRVTQVYPTVSLHQRRHTADSCRAQVSDERYALYVIICMNVSLHVCMHVCVCVYTYISLRIYACIDVGRMYRNNRSFPLQSRYVLLACIQVELLLELPRGCEARSLVKTYRSFRENY